MHRVKSLGNPNSYVNKEVDLRQVKGITESVQWRTGDPNMPSPYPSVRRYLTT